MVPMGISGEIQGQKVFLGAVYWSIVPRGTVYFFFHPHCCTELIEGKFTTRFFFGKIFYHCAQDLYKLRTKGPDMSHIVLAVCTYSYTFDFLHFWKCHFLRNDFFGSSWYFWANFWFLHFYTFKSHTFESVKVKQHYPYDANV